MSFDYGMAQVVSVSVFDRVDAVERSLGIDEGNTEGISISEDIGDNSDDISYLESSLNSEITATNSDFVALRLHSDEQDVVMLNNAEKFSSGLTAMSIATANSINSTGGDVELGLGIGFGSVNGEDAFAIGLVSQDADNKVSMSLNIGFNEHVDTTIGAGLFFKLR